MNNEQFRRLLGSGATSQDASTSSINAPPTTEQRRAALGSRQHSSIPMTPRTVRGSSSSGMSFARQVAENNNSGTKRASSSSKFKSSAPRGSRLADGYSDRTKERNDEDTDETAKQIKALEELFKKGDIQQDEFERLRDEITGGDVSKTHLVKGLDWKLLGRLRQGEDVHNHQASEKPQEEQSSVDVDVAFDDLEAREVTAVQKQQTEKVGQKADPLRRAATKKTRNEILAELKASRRRLPESGMAAQSNLNSKFKRIGVAEPTTRLERDERGREVLIITDADGNEKRKVRKTKDEPRNGDRFQEPAMKDEVLGADIVVPLAPPSAEESDDDIYADVGDDYNPLGDMDDDNEDEDEDNEPTTTKQSNAAEPLKREELKAEQAKPARTYFQDDPTTISVLGNMSNPLNDPTILAALAKKNADAEDTIQPHSSASAEAPTTTTDETAARLKRKAEMLAGHDRDLDDMDMGFGSSRHDDAADMDGSRVRLSEWTGGDADGNGDADDNGGHHDKKQQRKRGPKKRKGDKNNVSDVLKVMERQRG